MKSPLVGSYHWCDTRDMVVDGMTKGRCDRKPLQDLMRGYWELLHKSEKHEEAPKPAVPRSS